MNDHIVDEWVEASKESKRYGFFQKHPLDDRVMKLFAVACCREIWVNLNHECLRNAVELTELYADGLVSKEELIKAQDDAWKVIVSVTGFDFISLAAFNVAIGSAINSAVSASYYSAFRYSAFLDNVD